jgi:hypothetical protein
VGENLGGQIRGLGTIDKLWYELTDWSVNLADADGKPGTTGKRLLAKQNTLKK